MQYLKTIFLMTTLSSLCFAPGTNQNSAHSDQNTNSEGLCLSKPNTGRTADVCVAATMWSMVQCGKKGYRCAQCTTQCVQQAHDNFEKLVVPQPPDFKKKMQ